VFVCLFGIGTENEYFGFSQVPLAAVPYAKKARNFSSLLPRFIVRIPPSFPPFYRDEVPRAYRRDLQGMVCTVILLLAAWFLFRLGYRLAEKRSGRRERPGSNRVGACRVDEEEKEHEYTSCVIRGTAKHTEPCSRAARTHLSGRDLEPD